MNILYDVLCVCVFVHVSPRSWCLLVRCHSTWATTTSGLSSRSAAQLRRIPRRWVHMQRWTFYMNKRYNNFALFVFDVALWLIYWPKFDIKISVILFQTRSQDNCINILAVNSTWHSNGSSVYDWLYVIVYMTCARVCVGGRAAAGGCGWRSQYVPAGRYCAHHEGSQGAQAQFAYPGGLCILLNVLML